MSQITGKIIALFDTQVISEKFSKREVAVETTDQYPQQILVQFANKNLDKLNNFKVGDDVTIDYNLRGKAFNRKDGTVGYFNTIEGWKIAGGNTAPVAANPYSAEDDSELPF